jgi:hypothetical protein
MELYASAEERTRAVEAQQRWETEGVERGIMRYRRTLADAIKQGNEADLQPGQKMMHEIMRNLVPAILASRVEEKAKLQGRGNPSLSRLPLFCLDEHKIALITARCALASARAGRHATSLALLIAQQVRDERNFEIWRSSEAEKAKAEKQRGVPKPIDMYKVMVSRVKEVDARSARAWMKRAQKMARDFDKLEWSKEDRVHFGMHMIKLLVEHGGGWFETTLYWVHGKGGPATERHVVLSENAKEYLNLHHAQCELTRPWLLPMICPPNDWRYE